MTFNAFSVRPAGQKQRRGSGNWERGVNAQQRRLVRTFDEWATALKRDIASRARRGASIPELQGIIDDSIPRLESRLAEVLTAGVEKAVRSAAGPRADLPAVKGTQDKLIRENLQLLRESLIPKVHEKFTLGLAMAVPLGIIGGLAIDQQKAVALAIKNASAASRAAPAQYAGGYWVAVFKTQQTVGGVREGERAAQGLPIEPVRWVLDPNAEHCKPSPGFYGCVELAGEYPGGWSTLPTVPAGQTTCRGNDRCHIEVFRNGQWRRGVYDE
jgi:hypothetical protein